LHDGTRVLFTLEHDTNSSYIDSPSTALCKTSRLLRLLPKVLYTAACYDHMQ